MNILKNIVYFIIFFAVENIMTACELKKRQAVCPVSGVVQAESVQDEFGNITITYQMPSRGGYLESCISRQEGKASYTKFVEYPPMPKNKNAWWRVLASKL